MKKKLILAAAGAMAVFSLAACSSGSKDIATMKGSTITVDDFYNQIKEQSTSQQAFSQMVIYKVFEEKYGDKVTDKDIQKNFDEAKEQVEAQGGKFSDALKQAGLTEKTFKKQLKQRAAYVSKLLQKMMPKLSRKKSLTAAISQKLLKKNQQILLRKKMAVKLNLIHKQQLFLPKLKKLPSN